MKRLFSLAALFICVSTLGILGSTPDAAALPDDPGDQYWEAAPSVPAINGQVYALAVYNGLLIAGGQFTIACDPVATNIAAWNGTTWAALGTGTNGAVTALTVFNSALIAGGSFTTAGGVTANYMASWNGSAWSSLASYAGSPPAQAVKALTVYNGKLAVGTDYAVQTWTGYAWAFLGFLEPYNNMQRLDALTVFDNRLIAGGTFRMYGSEAYCVAAWDGYSWASTGSTCWWVLALGVYDNRLFVGGGFGLLDAWDGSTWSHISTGFGDYAVIWCLTVYRGKLIAAGDLFEGSCNNIASWDGSAWSALGSGTDKVILALSVFQDGEHDKLAVGGQFDVAGNKASPRFALWYPTVPVAVLIAEFNARPVNDGIALAWTLSYNEGIRGYRIYRSRGDDPTECALTDDLLDAAAREYIDRTALPGERYRYTLAVVNAAGGEVRSSAMEAGLPRLAARLDQNAPNPFNPTTSIRYTIPYASRVTMRIYSASGSLVRTLIDETMPAGTWNATWDGRSDGGAPVASGAYFCHMSADKTTLSIKMLLLR